MNSSFFSMIWPVVLPILALASHTPEAQACGNAMEHVIHHEPTTIIAMKYFEDHAYLQAADTAFDAHPELLEDITVYTRTEDVELRRASQIAAVSIVRLHGADYDRWHEKALGLTTPSARFEWAVEVLQWHHAHDADDLTSAVYVAEAQTRSSDPDTLMQAFMTLSLAAELDLMPDAHAWATLAALQRHVDFEDADAVASCEKIGGFRACDALPISLDDASPYASYRVKSKRREVVEDPFAHRHRRRDVIEW